MEFIKIEPAEEFVNFSEIKNHLLSIDNFINSIIIGCHNCKKSQLADPNYNYEQHNYKLDIESIECSDGKTICRNCKQCTNCSICLEPMIESYMSNILCSKNNQKSKTIETFMLTRSVYTDLNDRLYNYKSSPSVLTVVHNIISDNLNIFINELTFPNMIIDTHNVLDINGHAFFNSTQGQILFNLPKKTLYIKTQTGKKTIINCPYNTSVLSMKDTIENIEGIPVDQQRLIYKGKTTEDNKYISYYKIKDNDTIDIILRIRGGKPVILFYPDKKNNNLITETSVQLTLDESVWEPSLLYPTPSNLSCFSKEKNNNNNKGTLDEQDNKQIKWNIQIKPDGTISYNKQVYAYLFWEALTVGQHNFQIDLKNAFCTESIYAPNLLNSVLTSYGLNVKERQDLITYWLPELTENDYLVFQVICSLENKSTKKIDYYGSSYYQQVAKLEITPQPDFVLRIFLLFSPSSKFIKFYNNSKINIPINRNGCWVVEWGGMNTREYI